MKRNSRHAQNLVENQGHDPVFTTREFVFNRQRQCGEDELAQELGYFDDAALIRQFGAGIRAYIECPERHVPSEANLVDCSARKPNRATWRDDPAALLRDYRHHAAGSMQQLCTRM